MAKVDVGEIVTKDALSKLTKVTQNNIKDWFKRSSLFLVINKINRNHRIISSLVVRPRLIKGHQPYFTYVGTNRIDFTLYSHGESEDYWNKWIDNMKEVIRMHIKDGNLYVKKQ